MMIWVNLCWRLWPLATSKYLRVDDLSRVLTALAIGKGWHCCIEYFCRQRG